MGKLPVSKKILAASYVVIPLVIVFNKDTAIQNERLLAQCWVFLTNYVTCSQKGTGKKITTELQTQAFMYKNHLFYKAQIEFKSSFNTVSLLPLGFQLQQTNQKKVAPKHFLTSQNIVKRKQNQHLQQFSGVAGNILVLLTTITVLTKNTDVFPTDNVKLYLRQQMLSNSAGCKLSVRRPSEDLLFKEYLFKPWWWSVIEFAELTIQNSTVINCRTETKGKYLEKDIC